MVYLNALWSFLIVSSPYLLFGLLISGMINHFVPMAMIKKWLGKDNFASVLKASIVGIPLPLCSCSVIPTAVTLKKSGAGNGATSAFLISTPESGVDSISITYGLMDLPMTILRPLAAFVYAFFAGILQFWLNDFEYIETEPVKKSCCSKLKAGPVQNGTVIDSVVSVFKFGYGKLIDDISFWLTVGIILGALIDVIVPADFFSELSMLENRLMVLLIGIPLYVCASASTPIAVSLLLKGLSPGSAILFLLVGPATNISNIAVLQKYIGKKGVTINVFSIIFVALIFSFITDWLYANVFELKLNQILQSHDHSVSWWQDLCAAALVILLAKGLYKEEIKPRFKKAN